MPLFIVMKFIYLQYVYIKMSITSRHYRHARYWYVKIQARIKKPRH